MVNQKTQDEKIQQLVASLDDLLAFVFEAGALKNIAPSASGSPNLTKQQTKILQLTLMQVTECAYFITEYARNKKSGMLCKAFSTFY
jgi:hypothetical protein